MPKDISGIFGGLLGKAVDAKRYRPLYDAEKIERAEKGTGEMPPFEEWLASYKARESSDIDSGFKSVRGKQ